MKLSNKMLQTSVLFLVSMVMIWNVEAARILAYFPTPSRSHQVEIRALTHELARRGHEVVVVTPDPAFPSGKAPANITEIDVHDISYKILEEILVVHNMRSKIDMAYRILSFLKYFSMIVDTQLEVPEIKAILEKDRKHFDLLLLESMHRSILGLSHIFDCPVIQISFVGIAGFQYGDLGAASHPILYPTQERQRLYNLSFLEKGIEYFKQIAFHLVVKISQKEDYVVMQNHFGRDVPSVEELNRRVVMIFVNERKLWASNRPVAPNIQFIGGINLKPQKDLPEDLKKFLDSSKNGVIYVSFGTKVKTRILPEDKIVSMINVLSKLPYDILWKWDEDKLPTKSNNIKISKWFPQADLLKHPKVKLFIKQGGLQTTDEAIDAGVPVIGMPIYFGDEWYNVEKYAHFNIGLYLDIDTLTEEIFEKSIITILSNESYRNNVMKLRGQMMNQPISPLELAVWWTEHVMQHGGEHFQPPSAFMSNYDYYEVNMIIVFALILLAVTATVGLVLRTVVCCVLRAGNVKLKRH